jgi:hypothetical protein
MGDLRMSGRAKFWDLVARDAAAAGVAMSAVRVGDPVPDAPSCGICHDGGWVLSAQVIDDLTGLTFETFFPSSFDDGHGRVVRCPECNKDERVVEEC